MERSFDFTNASSEKPRTVGLNGRMVSALTHYSHRVCGQWRRNEFESAAPVWREAPEIFFGRALHFFA